MVMASFDGLAIGRPITCRNRHQGDYVFVGASDYHTCTLTPGDIIYYIRQNNLTKDIFMEYDEITHLITLGETQVDAWQLDLIGKCE